MNSNRRTSFTIAMLAFLSITQTVLATEVKLEAKKVKGGKYFLRANAPYMPKLGALIVATPDKLVTNVERDVGNWSDVQQWRVRINDLVKIKDIEYKKGNIINIEVEVIAGPADGEESIIRLELIHSAEDFHEAFNRLFSKLPLQDRHDDWTPEIKEAINNRDVMKGMSKRQVYYITGVPESYERHDKDGESIETWFPYNAYELPRMIVFVGGKLDSFGDIGFISIEDGGI